MRKTLGRPARFWPLQRVEVSLSANLAGKTVNVDILRLLEAGRKPREGVTFGTESTHKAAMTRQ